MDPLTLTAWQRQRLQRQLRETHDARAYRRTLAVLEVARGEPVAAVARLLRVTPRAVYYWVATYARGHDPQALADRDRPGRPSVLTPSDRLLLRQLLGQSPQDLGYFAAEWTVPLLQEHLAHCTGRRPSDDTLRRELERQDYTWKRSRYDLDPDPELGGKKAAPAPGYPAVTAAQRRPGRGRDRPAAVPAVARCLVAARSPQEGPAQRPQRATRHLRGDESADGPAAVPATGAAASGRLPGVPAGGPFRVPRLACGAAAGRGSQPYGQGVGPVG